MNLFRRASLRRRGEERARSVASELAQDLTMVAVVVEELHDTQLELDESAGAWRVGGESRHPDHRMKPRHSFAAVVLPNPREVRAGE